MFNEFNQADRQVLVIDDSPLIRNLLRVVLESEYQVLEAENGKSGLELTLEFRPDLIITDLMMPELDGYQLVKQVRDNGHIAHIPIIMLTTVNTEFNQLEGYRIGVDAYLLKPFTRDDLLIRVNNLIKNRVLAMEYASIRGERIPGLTGRMGESVSFKSRLDYFLEKELSNTTLKVKLLADSLAMSVSTFERRVKDQLQTTPKLYIRDYRLDRAMLLLQRKADNVSGIARQCGFDNISYFSLCFREKFGSSPSHVLNSGAQNLVVHA